MGLWALLAAFAAGVPLVTAPADPAGFARAVEAHGVSHAILPAAVLRRLSGHPCADRFDLGSLAYVAAADGPCSAALQVEAASRLRCVVGQLYGTAEAGLIAASLADDLQPGSAGRLAPGVRTLVVDPESGLRVGPGEPGELWVWTPVQPCAGATGEHGWGEGWVQTGDLASIDDEGEVPVVDRLAELIMTNGFCVAPAELEAVLAEVPGVIEAVVAPTPRPAQSPWRMPC